ncbi:MAG: transcriptional repressor [Clostridia bacterium]|nr:transcriptional repressor [Clostridia bacterium]
MRYSKQRELILETLKGVCSHPTADELYGMVKKAAPDISLGTVYRNLNQLADNGDILKITSGSSGDRFDYPRFFHFHFRCTHCGCVSDIPEEYTQEMKSLAEKLGAGSLIAEGLCASCRGELQ